MNAHVKPLAPSAAEWQARVDLAACHRLAAHFGFNEGIDNHLTLMLPGHEERFLLAPFGLHWSEVKASDFMVIDFEGRLVSGPGPVEDTALFIHLPVHRTGGARARCVLHTHMPHATALSMLENPRLEMAVQSALMFAEDIAYVDYNGLAFDAREGERLAHALGEKSVLVMRNHGVLVTGRTVPEAFERLYFLERAAQAQILALSTGRTLRPVAPSLVRTTLQQFSTGGEVGGRDRALLHFEALKRLLDRSHADYAS